MEKPKETAQSSGKLGRTPGTLESSRVVPVPIINDGKGPMKLDLDDVRAKPNARKPSEMLIWRGRARRFSMGMMSRRPISERLLDVTKVHVPLVNAGSAEIMEDSPVEERKETFMGGGVGHTSAALENTYFRRLCGAEESNTFGSLSTTRDRNDSAREGHTSLASVVTQRYKAQVGVDWSPARSNISQQSSSSPRPPVSARRHSPQSSLDTLGLSQNPSVSVVVETIESKRGSASTRPTRPPPLPNSPRSSPFAPKARSPTSSRRPLDSPSSLTPASSDTISDAPRLTSPSSPALSSSRKVHRRPQYRSRSLSSPYFTSWSYGNIDVSHKVRILTIVDSPTHFHALHWHIPPDI